MLTVTERGTECLAPNSGARYRRRVFEVDLMRKTIMHLAVHGMTGFSCEELAPPRPAWPLCRNAGDVR